MPNQYVPGSGGSAAARRRAHADTRRLRRRVLWLLGAVLAATIAAGMWRSPALAVRRVRVSGVSALTPAEASQTAAAAAVPPGTNWAHAPVRELEARLSRLPWVARASVYRRLPPRLEVTIKQRVPAAVLTVASGRWELDAGGVVIRPARDGVVLPEVAFAGDLSVTPGRLVGREAVVGALTVIAQTSGRPGEQVAKIEVDQRGELCLNMKDTVAIRLGQVVDLTTKLALVHRIYEDEPGIGAKVAAIDLRCPDVPACTPRAAATPSPREAALQPTQPGPSAVSTGSIGLSSADGGGGRSSF